MSKHAIQTKNAPEAIGPYSQGVVAGNVVYVSGQLPVDPSTGELVEDNIVSQTRQSLANVAAILKENNMTLSDVVKTTVYLADIAEFNAMNEVYAEYFQDFYPARAAFQVAALPKSARVEIEVVAVK